MCVCKETGWWGLVVQAPGWLLCLLWLGPVLSWAPAARVLSHCNLLEVGSFIFCWFRLF